LTAPSQQIGMRAIGIGCEFVARHVAQYATKSLFGTLVFNFLIVRKLKIAISAIASAAGNSCKSGS
jgi:hypothetical protein